MSNIFNINRFGKVLTADCRKYFRNFGITLAVLSCLTVVLWLVTVIFDFTMPLPARWGMIYLSVLLAVIMVPARAFGDINLQREGVRFAMLPASNLEKYLSYVLFCLLTPVVVLFLAWGVDSLLTLLPFGGYVRGLKSLSFWNMIHDYGIEIGGDADLDDEGYADFMGFIDKFGPVFNFRLVVAVLCNVGIFMLGNLLFKTHKTGKTFACVLGFSYVVSTILQAFFISKGIFPWQQANPQDVSMATLAGFSTTSTTISIIIRTVLAVGLYIGIFFKLKTQKY